MKLRDQLITEAKRRGYTATSLAIECGTSPRVMQKYFKGDRENSCTEIIYEKLNGNKLFSNEP